MDDKEAHVFVGIELTLLGILSTLLGSQLSAGSIWFLLAILFTIVGVSIFTLGMTL
jgi:hypothetical protein